MLRAIRRFFEDQLSMATEPDSGLASDHALQLATAALAIETIRADRTAWPRTSARPCLTSWPAFWN